MGSPPPPVDTCTRPPGPGNGATNTSRTPLVSELYATHFPSGEKRAPVSNSRLSVTLVGTVSGSFQDQRSWLLANPEETRARIVAPSGAITSSLIAVWGVGT